MTDSTTEMIKLKTVRLRLGLNQTQMGKLMGMPQPSISRIERGDREETKIMLAFLVALEVLHELGFLDRLIDRLR